MRQRITRTPSRRGSGAWEISSEEDSDSVKIPMYNPLQYPAAPGSFPLSWHPQKAYQHAPLSYQGDLPSLSPAFIPDKNYDIFVRTGRPIARPQPATGLSKVCCAKFCAGLSFVAVGFLVFVGIIFDTQPLYIPGSLPKHLQYMDGGTQRTQAFYSVAPSVRLLPASNAYKAAALYFVTGCLSLAYAYNFNWANHSKWWQSYDEIPDTDSTVPTFHIPTHISPKRREYYSRGSLPDRIVESFRANYNRVRLYVVSMLPTHEHRRGRRREGGPKDV